MGNSQLTQDISALVNRVVLVQRTYTYQWIPAHVDIFCYKLAKSLAIEARNSLLSNSLTLTDAEAISRRKLTSHQLNSTTRTYTPRTIHFIQAVGSLVVRAPDSRPEGLGSPPNTLRVHTEYVLVKSVGPKVLRAESRVQGTGEYFPPLQFHA
ncbi:uncharacterized protein TNCV_4597591 [Trichonephila clavipes]|nr:uncharacterized protein TNCV_4597591 [Trichonephila clavipes]